MPRMRSLAAAVLAALVLPTADGCAQEPDAPGRDRDEAAVREGIGRALDEALDRIAARADSIDEVFKPLPLLTPAQEAALRRHPNRQQVARARTLGIPRPVDAAGLDALVREGRLVALEDSTEHWVVRELDHSAPFVIPDARALLVEIGERFQARLAGMGVPPFRLEVTSVLRTADDQASLRGTNPNAASEVSAHEFGTTVDIAYSGFAAPARPMAGVRADGQAGFDAAGTASGAAGGIAWLEPQLGRIAAGTLERVAARRSAELKAVLGHVLREMQAEGKVMVTLERQQPVYHLTVARRLEGRR